MQMSSFDEKTLIEVSFNIILSNSANNNDALHESL